MPYKDRAKQNAFNLKVIRERRERWLAANGPCAQCGSLNELEVDHVDPATKVSHGVWSWSEPRRTAELAKCQVLCRVCHQKKTTSEAYRPRVHGTVAMYKRGKCRCPLCREANSRYNKNGRRGATLIFVRPSDLRRANA